MNTPDDPRRSKSKSSKNFAIYAIIVVALVYVAVRIFLYMQSGDAS